MAYTVKEIYYTLQGEGARAGRAAVFCRFAACTLWTGREEDRAPAACWFCDPDVVGTDGPGGGRFTSAADLAAAIAACWRGGARDEPEGVEEALGAFGAAEHGGETRDAPRIEQRGIGGRQLLGEDDRALGQALETA